MFHFILDFSNLLGPKKQEQRRNRRCHSTRVHGGHGACGAPDVAWCPRRTSANPPALAALDRALSPLAVVPGGAMAVPLASLVALATPLQAPAPLLAPASTRSGHLPEVHVWWPRLSRTCYQIRAALDARALRAALNGQRCLLPHRGRRHPLPLRLPHPCPGWPHWPQRPCPVPLAGCAGAIGWPRQQPRRPYSPGG
ncbi:hypothetical protein ABZP36_033503 [Zizania latifolia]